jgi:UPF0271 protein
VGVLLNIDLGELPDEPEELYALAQVANIACGGHAGDEGTMWRALERCTRYGTRVSAHPSFEDREHFGRRALTVPEEKLREQVRAQCRSLRILADQMRLAVTLVKPHGALYHQANAHPEVARAVVDGALAALGTFTLIGPPKGCLESLARERGLKFWAEGFADRKLDDDGRPVSRSEPDALITDPARARAQAETLVRSSKFETLCVHGDTPNAVEIARAVRELLNEFAPASEIAAPSEDERSLTLFPRGGEPMGEAALVFYMPKRVPSRLVWETLRNIEGVVDVVVSGDFVCVSFEPERPPEGLEHALAKLALNRLASGNDVQPAPGSERLHHIRIRYDGPDLAEVARRIGVSTDEVVRLHSSRDYRVQVVGFLPGFAYLGEVDPKLNVPRRASPRPRVPANAVGLAGLRTAIYPWASPGGWHLIGTAVDFIAFDPEKGATLRLGDGVRFEPQ